AGLSSLDYLKQLPAKELKIDKMFVMQLTSSNRDPLIVRSTIDLAHALEMEVTAEGVETPSALALLSVMGCDMVQGFLISRPLGIDAFCQFLDDEDNLKASGNAHSSFIRPESFWKRAGAVHCCCGCRSLCSALSPRCRHPLRNPHLPSRSMRILPPPKAP